MTGNLLSRMVRSVSHLLAAVFNDRSQFEREWKCSPDTSGTAAGVQSRWEGEWRSDANGHHGALKCILTKNDGEHYMARFHAVYGGFLKVCYHVPLNVRGSNGEFTLEGRVDLGRLAGGVYEYRGTATGEEFSCDYRCKYDHGTFRMSSLDRANP